MDQEREDEVREEIRDQDQVKGALAGENLEKEQKLEEQAQGVEGLEMDQEQGEGVLVEVDLEQQYFSLNMAKIQNLSIHRKPERKDTREKFC